MSDTKDKKDEIIEEIAAPVEEKKADEKKPDPKPQKKGNRPDGFIQRKLKVINNMNNPAKQMRLAERVLNNRKAGK